MPHLIYGGRYWRVAGDELFLPGFCAMFWRTAWTGLLIAILVISYDRLGDCNDGWVLTTFLSVSTASFMLAIVCEICLVWLSLKGTMIDNTGRQNICFFLSCHVVLGVFQLVCAIFGMMVITRHNSGVPCGSKIQTNTDVLLMSVVVISQIIDFLSLVCCCFMFSAQRVTDPLLPRDTTHDEDVDEHYLRRIGNASVSIRVTDFERRAESYCRTLCKSIQICSCNAFGGGHLAEDLEAVAKVLTNFFQHDGLLDVVPSDVVAGIILTRLQQRYDATLQYQEHRKVSGENYNSSADSVNAYCASGNELSQSNPHTSLLPTHPPTFVDTMDDQWDYSDNDKVEYDEPNCPIPCITMQAMAEQKDSFKHHRMFGRRYMSTRNAQDQAMIPELHHYSLFALAIYTHLLFIYMKPATAICRMSYASSGCSLCGKLNNKMPHYRRGCCCCCCDVADSPPTGHSFVPNVGSDHPNGPVTAAGSIIGDNMCGANESAILSMISNTGAEIAHASFLNNIVARPYAIFLDHSRHTVIISIRGTLSLEDCVADVIVEPEELKQAGRQWGFHGTGRYAHKGMLRSAEYLRAQVDPLLKSIFQTLIEEQYNLVVTGHSLGAGTAILLAVLLKPSYPSLKCYAYGTPGSVLDTTTAEEVKSYVVGVCLGSDIVCRLSIRSMALLREHVLDTISRAKVNKFTIMQSMFKKNMTPHDLMYAKGTEPNSIFSASVAQYNARIRSRLQEEIAAVALVTPGRIIHLARTHTETLELCCGSLQCAGVCNSRSCFTPIEAHIGDMEHIPISGTMVWDHFPDRYVEELSRLNQKWKTKQNR